MLSDMTILEVKEIDERSRETENFRAHSGTIWDFFRSKFQFRIILIIQCALSFKNAPQKSCSMISNDQGEIKEYD